jgi:DNA invertase Pin-like site-specific DNA recombinase
MDVLGYLRVSTSEQADSGAGLAAQETAIRAECDRRGWTIASMETDPAASGRTTRRPGLERALAALDRGEAQALVVAKLDRLSRSVVDFASLIDRAQRRGWSVVVLDLGVDTTTVNGRMLANVMASLAQWEREIIGERTKAALAEKRRQGVLLGRPRTVPAETQRLIVSLRESGLTWRAIAGRLNAEGVPTGQGGARWHANVARLIAQRAP